MATSRELRRARRALVHARVADLGEVELLLRREHVELVRRGEVDVPPRVQEQLGDLGGNLLLSAGSRGSPRHFKLLDSL